MATTELKPDKILTLDTFVEILEAVDEKVRKNEPDKIEKLIKIQGALNEILTKAYEYEMLKKEENLTLIFPYETLINIEVLTNQIPRQKYTEEMLSKLV